LLDENELTGSLPAELGSLRYLEEIYLSSTNWCDSVVLWFSEESKLLKINGNDLEPYSILSGLLTNLETIGLESNALSRFRRVITPLQPSNMLVTATTL
jgi:hypothetical protein